MKNIVILISGSGSNMAAIVQTAQAEQWAQRLGARVCAVISNRPDAAGLAVAQFHGIATEVVAHTAFAAEPHPREAFDAALMVSGLTAIPQSITHTTRDIFSFPAWTR